MSEPTVGLDQGLTNYGDRDFSRYMRRSFAQSMGYSRALLDKPVKIGRITDDVRIVPVSVTEGLANPDPWSPWLARNQAQSARKAG